MNLKDFIKKHGNFDVDEKELKDFLGIKDEKYYIPRNDEEYYFVTPFGGIAQWFNRELLSDRDEGLIKNSEVFRTEEEAEEHAKKRRFLLKMKRDFLDNSDEIKWNNEAQNKYYLILSHLDENIEIDYTKCVTPIVDFATTNKKWLEEYIKEYEKEIKKYYFGIEEEK